MQTLMDAVRIRETMAALAQRVADDAALHAPSGPPLALIGIRSRGELIAQRLAAALRLRWGGTAATTTAAPPDHRHRLDVGALDITFYRDDLASRRAITIPRGTDMNFRLDDRAVLLCDDVLETGRSVRAALDALVDFGRPRLIRLAVLVDRGRRELPIAADYAGLTLHAPSPQQKIIVHLQPTDPEDAVYINDASAAPANRSAP